MKERSEPKPQTKMRKVTGPTKGKKLRRRPICLTTGSIFDRMRSHAGVSLFVRPLQWTDLHTKLLGCRFVQLPPHNTPTPRLLFTPNSSPPSQPRLRISETVVSIGKNLDILMAPHAPSMIRDAREKDMAMATLLSTFYPGYFSDPLCCADLDVLFGTWVYRGVVNCQLLWHQADPHTNVMSFDSTTTRVASQPVSRAASYSMDPIDQSPNNSPILAYINRSNLNHTRKHLGKIPKGPKWAPNKAVARLMALRCKALIPKNTDEDPYFLAVMVVMAQQSVYTNMWTRTGFTPRDVKVRLLTVAEEDNALIVYTATIPAALLSMFHEPKMAPTGNSDVVIEHTRVPVWPVLGLKERLGKALGSDLVGEFDDSIIDTFQEKVVPVAEADSKKRRREALSEVLNGSFCENSQYKSGPSARKKRCMEQKKGRSCSITA